MRIIVSTYEKEGLLNFFKKISGMRPEIYASDGTYKFLQSNNVKCEKVSTLTGFDSLLGGRVKTLHPALYAGILSRRDASSNDELQMFGYKEFDLVISNLYPFKEAAVKGDLDEMIENIDVGGVSLIRAAAKNFSNVAVVVDQGDYGIVADQIAGSGSIDLETRKVLALKAFAYVSIYDMTIYRELHSKIGASAPEHLFLHYSDGVKLRYGENPDQTGSLYSDGSSFGIPGSEKLNGKELSYNNILDASSALETVLDFSEPTAVIVKHNTPCGVCSSDSLKLAFQNAFNADSESAYGSVIALNREVDAETAIEISRYFVEAVVAPSFSAEALDTLKKKKNLRILKVAMQRDSDLRYRSVIGGMLSQSQLNSGFQNLDLKTTVMSEKKDIEDLEFAWKVSAHCRSNAIVLAKNRTTTGIGAGQTSRIEALRIAVARAGDKAKGSVMASDGFLPFSDNVELAANSGISAIIQPGGSIRDKEVLDASNRYGIPMYFTGKRVFLH
jgi:phosphoribosylaminoimidazolecarboxamide formyltransferase/IMP cyclohydrolase